jgi:peptide/nickel transport system substrate-binding protein
VLERLAGEYPLRERLHGQLMLALYRCGPRQPPFTSLKARQAVSYAIDRARIMQIYHDGPGEAAVTCQILPADFPGHQPYCRYTAGPKNGFWRGPDLAKGRRLAQQPGTTDSVWGREGPVNRAR